jgi:hypothetical protein
LKKTDPKDKVNIFVLTFSYAQKLSLAPFPSKDAQTFSSMQLYLTKVDAHSRKNTKGFFNTSVGLTSVLSINLSIIYDPQ